MFKMINWYPPMLGAGIKVIATNADVTSITVEMKLRWWNKNIVGTQFGGSLYMMCDPFFMAILMTNLGRDYVVWDKAASIQFLKPGRKHVRAIFHIPHDEIDRVRALADAGEKVTPHYDVDILDTDGVLVARVHKVLYVRRKPAKGEQAI
ncbi:translation elongation factor P (EF-P) [Asticcacaulis sp. AC402]|nr:translation elongation factor P (EF-P) [Asticcacaulis sp. AC402]